MESRIFFPQLVEVHSSSTRISFADLTRGPNCQLIATPTSLKNIRAIPLLSDWARLAYVVSAIFFCVMSFNAAEPRVGAARPLLQ